MPRKAASTGKRQEGNSHPPAAPEAEKDASTAARATEVDPRTPVHLVHWGGSAVVLLANGDTEQAPRYSGEVLAPLIAACEDPFTLRQLQNMLLDTQAMRAIGQRLSELEG